MKGGGEESFFKIPHLLSTLLFFKTLHVSGISAANAAIITLN